MNLFKKTTSVVMAIAIIFLQGVTAFAAETTTNIAGEPIDRSGQVTRSVSPSVTGEYKKAIKAGISGSWGNTYSKSESFTVNVAPNKTVWVTFIPIMDKSQGKVQKYFIPRGGISKKPVIEKSYDIVTYNPKYLTSKMGPFTFKTVYGVYVWHEK